MSNNEHAYALLIGVGDYRAFDPSGAHDLKGPVPDALGWWALTRELGIPPENVRICAAPTLDRARLGKDGAGVTLTGATGDEIEAGLRWLAGALDGKGGTKGLLTYSGHGGRSRGEQVICPTDVKWVDGALAGALPVGEIADLLDARAEATRLTAFVDTCHSGRGVPAIGGTARVLGGTEEFDDVPGDEPADDGAGAAKSVRGRLGDLVIASSAAGTPSFEIPLAVGVRGAFSWAAQSLLARWGAADAAGGATFGLTYGDICGRAVTLLRALGVEQQPVFEGEAPLARLRAFSGFGDRAVGDAAAETLGRLEIWPNDSGGRVIAFQLRTSPSGGSYLGMLYVTDGSPPSGKGWTSNCMYWAWSGGSFPTSTFYAVAYGEWSGSAPSSATVYEANAMTPGYSAASLTIPSGHYKISEVHHSGYVYVTGSAQTVYSSILGASSLAGGFATLEFNHSSGATSGTVYSFAVDPIK